jgi:hypothetical protein
MFHEPEDFADRFLLFEIGVEADVGIVNWSHASLSLSSVEGEIAADGKKPLRNVSADFFAILAAQAQESLLNNFPGPFSVAKHPRGVPDQGVLV